MSRPITVVQWWPNYPKSPSSGLQRFIEIAQRCHEEGWRSYLVCTKMPDDTGLIEPFRKAGCELIVQPRQRREFDLACIWRTYRLLRRLRCDILHCNQAQTSLLIGAFLAGVPARVWSVLAMSPYYEKNTRPKGLHRLMLSNRVSGLLSHRILAISEAVGLELRRQGVPGESIDTVHVPVDYARFAEAVDGDIRHSLRLDPSLILITAVGHAFPVKGWDIALQAFARVLKEIPHVRLLLVGGIDTNEREKRYFQELTDLSKNLSVSDHVYFLGKRNDIPGILKASDIFIFPSRSEGMGSALIEAIAAGLPCIAARVGGIPDVITHGENGFLFERENVEELASHLIRLIEDQQLRERVASNASKRARAFSMEGYVDKVFECYKALLSRNCARISENDAT